MGVRASIESLSQEGMWNPGSTSGEWSPGGLCGCGSSSGGLCLCGGSCGCKGDGCSSDMPLLTDYQGEIWASRTLVIDRPAWIARDSDRPAGSGLDRVLDESFFRSLVDLADTWRVIGGGEGACLDGDGGPLSDRSMTDQGLERICGPDVTDFVARQYAKIIDKMGSDGILSGPVMVGYGSDIDLKGRYNGDRISVESPRVSFGRCPTNCGWTVTLCGKCISNQIPGNMGLGIYGQGLATAVGFVAYEVSMGDSDEDRAAYFWGDFLKRAFDDLKPVSAARGESAEILLRDIICAIITVAVQSTQPGGCYNPRTDFKEIPCGECRDPRSLPDRKVKVRNYNVRGPSGPQTRFVMEPLPGTGWNW